MRTGEKTKSLVRASNRLYRAKVKHYGLRTGTRRLQRLRNRGLVRRYHRARRPDGTSQATWETYPHIQKETIRIAALKEEDLLKGIQVEFAAPYKSMDGDARLSFALERVRRAERKSADSIEVQS